MQATPLDAGSFVQEYLGAPRCHHQRLSFAQPHFTVLLCRDLRLDQMLRIRIVCGLVIIRSNKFQTCDGAHHNRATELHHHARLAAIAIDASPRGLLGALVQYQSSFAGDSDRQHVESATFQPFIIHNLPKGWYLRSTGTWTRDLKNNTHYIPVGLGVGKAWKAGSNILNAFVEPQWTVERKGDDLPQFTLFAGINVTFGK